MHPSRSTEAGTDSQWSAGARIKDFVTEGSWLTGQARHVAELAMSVNESGSWRKRFLSWRCAGATTWSPGQVSLGHKRNRHPQGAAR
jgi:hypothetical protein